MDTDDFLKEQQWFKAVTIRDPEGFDVDLYLDYDGLHISQPSEPSMDDVVHMTWAQFDALLTYLEEIQTQENQIVRH